MSEVRYMGQSWLTGRGVRSGGLASGLIQYPPSILMMMTYQGFGSAPSVIEPKQEVTFADATIGTERTPQVRNIQIPSLPKACIVVFTMFLSCFYISINMSFRHKMCKITFSYNSIQHSFLPADVVIDWNSSCSFHRLEPLMWKSRWNIPMACTHSWRNTPFKMLCPIHHR